MRKTLFILLLLILATPSLQAFDYQGLLKKVSGASTKTSLNDTQIGAGLKEALKVGIDKTIQITGKKDGYYANQAIKILMPEKLQIVENGMRKLGLQKPVDEFVLSMNRAAEKAAPAARDIFIDSIMSMTIEDVQKVYQGGDTAATQFFQSKTSAKLKETYRPIIQRTMNEYGVTRQYQSLMNKTPLAKNFQSLNIENYVVDKSMAGLFKVLGEQEKAIRQDPKARVTSLLKEVFGNQSMGGPNKA